MAFAFGTGIAAFSQRLYLPFMTTTLQAWGNSQGVRLPKTLLNTLGWETGAEVEVQLTPGKDAIIVKATRNRGEIRGRHRIEDLVAAMPKGYKSAEFEWGISGKEVW